jgi:hypothetical protein
MSAGLSQEEGRRVLALAGRNLVLRMPMPLASRGETAEALGTAASFPVAVLDNRRVEVLSATENDIRIAIPESMLGPSPAVLKVALDPYAVISLEIKP